MATTQFMDNEMILALDLATQTGFVTGSMAEHYSSGVLVFDAHLRAKDKCRPAVLAEAQTQIEALIEQTNPDRILFEAPFFRGAGSRLLSGFCALVEASATRRHIPVQETSSSQARKLVLGSGNATKQDIKAWLEAQNIEFPTDDEADAYILYLSHFKRLN